MIDPSWRSPTNLIILKPQEILFQQGDVAQNLFWLDKGRIKLVEFTETQLILHHWVNSDEFFAETALFEPTYRCTAIATHASAIVAINRQEFFNALNKSEILTKSYLTHLTKRFSHTKQLLTIRSIHSARDRLLYYLLKHLQGIKVILPSSLKDVALELGISSETLSRSLANLEAVGIIHRKKGSVIFSSTWLTNHLK